MVKKNVPVVKENPEASFVKIENANMLKLTLKQLGKLYTQYARLILDIKDLKDRKEEIRKSLFNKMTEFEESFGEYTKVLPKDERVVKPAAQKTAYPTKTPVVEYEYGDAFTNLRKEFERIREELEKMT
jgi:hypothetical protein